MFQKCQKTNRAQAKRKSIVHLYMKFDKQGLLHGLSGAKTHGSGRANSID